MYQYGKGVKKDDLLAAQWYLKAAKQGNEKAKKALNTLGLKITEGIF